MYEVGMAIGRYKFESWVPMSLPYPLSLKLGKTYSIYRSKGILPSLNEVVLRLMHGFEIRTVQRTGQKIGSRFLRSNRGRIEVEP